MYYNRPTLVWIAGVFQSQYMNAYIMLIMTIVDRNLKWTLIYNQFVEILGTRTNLFLGSLWDLEI